MLAAPPYTEPELLRLAGAVEHGSGHLLARTLSDEVAARGIVPADAHEVTESPGEGVTGRADDMWVTVGGWAYVLRRHPGAEAGLRAALAADGTDASGRTSPSTGSVRASSSTRTRSAPGSPASSPTCDGWACAGRCSSPVTIRPTPRRSASPSAWTKRTATCCPEQKVAFVQRLVKEGERVLMVGDGTNDAPALSSATVGIALASGGGGITAEAADAVLLADDPTRIAEAIAISRRTLRLARQSIWAGLGLSGVAMVAASLGYIPPVAGALLQEGIDVAVILNALRAAFPPTSQRPRVASR